MVTWAEIDDFTQDLERLCDPIPIEVYIKEGIPYRLFPQNFKDLIIRICKEGLEDEHGNLVLRPYKGEYGLKTRMLSWIQIELNLSEYPKEVSNYVFDQIENKLDDLDTEEVEIERDYESQKLIVTSPLIDLIQQIIEEKEGDMAFEKRAAREVLEAGYRALDEARE